MAGAILALDPVAVNLAGGYPKFGVALQLTAEAEAELDGTRANGLIISHFLAGRRGSGHERLLPRVRHSVGQLPGTSGVVPRDQRSYDS